MLWFVVNTDLTITTEKLVELFEAMSDDYLDYIGFSFDLPLSKTDEIQMNYHSSSQRSEAYLDLYATDHPCPSWREVAEILSSVHLRHQAGVVESTYVQGTILHRSLHASDNVFAWGGVGIVHYVHTCLLISSTCIPYSGKLSREKTRGFVLSTNVFSVKINGHTWPLIISGFLFPHFPRKFPAIR